MNVFRKIWLVWATTAFLLLMFLSIPVIVFNMVFSPGERALNRNIHYLHHIFTPSFLAVVGIRLQVEGKEKLNLSQSYVIVGNHSSALDFIVNAHAFPGVFRFLAKQELQKIPIFGWVVKKMCLTVDRSSAMSRARSVVALKQNLANGWSIFIYPEGSRNKTKDLIAPFYDGAFRIAIQTKAPIAVQTILNVAAVAGEKADGLQPGVLKIVWETPIETVNLNDTDILTLRDEVAGRMRARLHAYKSALHAPQ